MNPSISFETTLQLLAVAHVAPLMLLLAASNVCLAIIEAFEEADSYFRKFLHIKEV